MKSAWRLTLALIITVALAACKSTPEPEAVPEQEPVDETPVVETQAAPDPRDYTDSRNFDNPESLLSKRVIYFDFDKSELRDDARNTLSQNADWLKKSYNTAVIEIEGHCDERGSDEYNLALGESRALAAKNYLVSLGVPMDQLGTISYGEEVPLDLSGTEEAWAKNRRVEIVYERK